MEKKVNCLGLDKFQTAILNRNFKTIEPFLAKRNKAKEKLNDVIKKAQEKYDEEVALLNMQIEAFDNITKGYTEKSCGYKLTSEQCMEFLENPNKFEEFKKKNPLQAEMEFKETISNTVPSLDDEEDKDWEDMISSGKLHEVNN